MEAALLEVVEEARPEAAVEAALLEEEVAPRLEEVAPRLEVGARKAEAERLTP